MVDPEWMTSLATHADSLGYDSLVMPEHVVVVSDYQSTYPYARSGRMPLPDDCPIPDPLDLLAFVAAATTSIGLATGVLILPAHHPVTLARAARPLCLPRTRSLLVSPTSSGRMIS